MKAIVTVDDPRYIKAMSHPVRVRIMAMLSERKASPNELSQWLGTTLGATAYHVRTLHNLGLIELVSETRVRGAVEHHYRATVRPKLTQENWSTASPVAKQATIGANLQTLHEQLNAAAAAGGFDRADARWEGRSVRLDEKGWAALSVEVGKLLDRIEKIEAAAAKRLERASGEGEIQAGVVALTFESVSLGDQIPPSTKKRKPTRRTRSR